MTDRSELGDGKRQQHAEALTDNELAGAIIVPQRSSQNSAKLLPPILILMLATAFLAYRSGRSSDWRGISAFFETQSPRRASAAPPLLARASEKLDAPVVTSESIAPEPPSATASPAEPKPVEAAEVPAPPEPAANALPKVAETADPISDIAREAEKTKERIAELEKMKANESRKLEETAEERQREDNID